MKSNLKTLNGSMVFLFGALLKIPSKLIFQRKLSQQNKQDIKSYSLFTYMTTYKRTVKFKCQHHFPPIYHEHSYEKYISV